MPPSVPKLILRSIAPDGLLPRQSFSLVADAASSQCTITSGKRTLGVCTNVAAVVPETSPSVSVATANTPDVVTRLLAGYNQTVFVLGLAGSGTSAFLDGNLPKNALGGYLDGLMKSLFEALKVKAAPPAAVPPPAVPATSTTTPTVPAAATATAPAALVTAPAETEPLSYSVSISVHEHYSELVRDLLSSKRDKEVDTTGIQWDPTANATLATLTRRSIATHGDAMDAIGKSKLAKTNVKGRTEKTTVVYQVDLVQHVPMPGATTADIVSTLHVVELFAIDKLVTDQTAHAQVHRDGEAVGKQMMAIDAGFNMLGKGPFESLDAEDEPSEPFNVEQSLVTFLLHPLFEFNADLTLIALVNTGSDTSTVASLFTYLSNLTATVRTYPIAGTQDALCARRVRRTRELQIKAQAELALQRLALDGGKDDLRQRLVTVTRDNDRFQDTISNLTAQLADVREQLKVATALRDDSEAHLSVTSASQMAAAAEVARLADRLSSTSKELESVRARLVMAETERDNVTRALSQSTDKCASLTSELDNMRLRLAVLETQVAGARQDLGGEADQAEELSVELLRVVQRQASVEKEKRKAAEQVRVLRMRLKELENDKLTLTRENEQLVSRIREMQTRPVRAGSPHATLASETLLSVAERVEADLHAQLKTVQDDLEAARNRYREMGVAYRNRLQQYVDTTCNLNLANEGFSTIKAIVDSMLKDVIMSLMESEQHAHSALTQTRAQLKAAHDLVVQLLHLAILLQGGKGGVQIFDKIVDAHQRFEHLMTTGSLEQATQPAKSGKASSNQGPPDTAAACKMAQDTIARYIATTHSQMEEERSKLLTRALLAEAAVKEWETIAFAKGLTRGKG